MGRGEGYQDGQGLILYDFTSKYSSDNESKTFRMSSD